MGWDNLPLIWGHTGNQEGGYYYSSGKALSLVFNVTNVDSLDGQ